MSALALKDLDRNKDRRRLLAAQVALARLPTPGEQQALGHSMPAGDIAHSLPRPECLFNQPNLLVVS
jgi:hypothetical protein